MKQKDFRVTVRNKIKDLSLGTHLFVKVLRPGDSYGTFSVIESSCHLLIPVEPIKGKGNPVKCLAQGHTGLSPHTSPFKC